MNMRLVNIPDGLRELADSHSAPSSRTQGREEASHGKVYAGSGLLRRVA